MSSVSAEGNFVFLIGKYNFNGRRAAFNPEELKVPSFANYVEGIYVGYRFYETALVTPPSS